MPCFCCVIVSYLGVLMTDLRGRLICLALRACWSREGRICSAPSWELDFTVMCTRWVYVGKLSIGNKLLTGDIVARHGHSNKHTTSAQSPHSAVDQQPPLSLLRPRPQPAHMSLPHWRHPRNLETSLRRPPSLVTTSSLHRRPILTMDQKDTSFG